MELVTLAPSLDTRGDCDALLEGVEGMKLEPGVLEVVFAAKDQSRRVMVIPRFPWDDFRNGIKDCALGDFDSSRCAPYFRLHE
jgi:hypothetical protein